VSAVVCQVCQVFLTWQLPGGELMLALCGSNQVLELWVLLKLAPGAPGQHGDQSRFRWAGCP